MRLYSRLDHENTTELLYYNRIWHATVNNAGAVCFIKTGILYCITVAIGIIYYITQENVTL